jgi:hypothetical protein
MQKTLIGKQISVCRVSSDIAWCRLYCCTTVDTALRHSERLRTQDAYIRSPSSSIGLLSHSAALRRRLRAQPQRDTRGVVFPTISAFVPHRSVGLLSYDEHEAKAAVLLITSKPVPYFKYH